MHCHVEHPREHPPTARPCRHLLPIRITRYTLDMSESTTTQRTRPRSPNNRTTTGFRVSDALWAVLEPLIPVRLNTHRFGGGRPRVPDRRCADAIFYVLRTGCQWEALNQTDLCAKSTAHNRFREWVAAGVFLKLWYAGVEQFDELQGIDLAWLSMDGALTKAPLGGKDGAEPGRPRQRRRQAQSADRRARGAERVGNRRRQAEAADRGSRTWCQCRWREVWFGQRWWRMKCWRTPVASGVGWSISVGASQLCLRLSLAAAMWVGLCRWHMPAVALPRAAPQRSRFQLTASRERLWVF